MKNKFIMKCTSLVLTVALLLTVSPNDIQARGESTGLVTEKQTTSSVDSSAITTTDDTHAQIVNRSLVSVGNNKRIKAAIAKAQNGEEVTLAYLGGSITQGVGANPEATNCYASLATQIFAEKYAKDKDKVKYINAGIAGTPSTLGIVRCQDDIISKKPDIVFLEFAVNDGTDNTSQVIYESLVKKLLDSNSSPAVVLIFTVLKNGYNAQDHMSKIGAYYDLGMISIKNAIFPEIEAGRMQFLKDYASDDAHPNNTGHALVAEFIGNYFDKAFEKETDSSFNVPTEPIIGTDYATLKNITANSSAIIKSGDFKYSDLSCFTYTKGWIRTSTTTANKPMVMKLTFNKMIISYKQENNVGCGAVDVYIDGKKTATLKGKESWAWGNVATYIINTNDKKATKHKVELKMAKGDEKKRFTLLGIGYVK